MIDNKQTKISTKTGIIIILSLFVLIFLISMSSPNKDLKVDNVQTTPVYTAENCIHDLAIRNANAVKKDMDSGVPFSETKEINRLSEYEKQKTECYKNFQ